MLQRKCACGQHTGGEECEECKKKKELQRWKGSDPEPTGIPPVVHDVLRSPGQPLAPAVRAAMEPRFARDFSQVRLRVSSPGPQSELTVNEPGDAFEREAERIASAVAGDSNVDAKEGARRDFSQVRVHTDSRAATAARALNSRAFTLGDHVVFGAGQYAPATPTGKELLAHELTHVIQQGGSATGPIARAPLDLKRLDLELFWGDPLTQTSGEIGKSATCKRRGKTPPELPIEAFVFPSNTEDVPGQGGKPGAKASVLPGGGSASGTESEKPTEKEWPPSSPRKIANHPGRSDWRKDASGLLVPAKRAVIVGGIHGDERGPLDVAKGLKDKLDKGAPTDFDTIFIPIMNPGGVEDKTRENRCGVDLNRNFPGLTSSPATTAKVPAEQPETKAVREVIEILKPSRILALHAHDSPTSAGAFADPSSDPKAVELACRMAVRMRNKPGSSKRDVNVRGNKLDTGFCSALYPDQGEIDASTKHSSLGTWASGPESAGGMGIPVITHEVSGKSALADKGDRSVEAILPGIEEFLLDNEHLRSEADEILAQSVSNEFLTGESTSADDKKVRDEIQARVLKDFAKLQDSYKTFLSADKDRKKRLNAAGAGALTKRSHFRSFADQSGIVKGELKTRKITSKSTDQEIKVAIVDIMTTRSVPGFSRHAWGTEIDVIDPTAKRWKPGGDLAEVTPFLEREAPKHGFFHPYSSAGGKRPAPGYEDEPWHLSYWRIADILQAEWMRRISGTELDDLVERTAAAIGPTIDRKRLVAILKSLKLEDFQKNVAASPGQSATGVGP
ncbi:MAG TPA: DUF4157 domain-containing protein [Thermoanaerobaculia bacterium]